MATELSTQGGAKIAATLAGPVAGANPAALLSGVKAFAFGHPLAMAGVLGGSLLLLGLYDLAVGRRARKLAELTAVPPESAENIW
ncbi:MAG: hypothetical protein ACKN9W_14875 [Methylococcus sp.]